MTMARAAAATPAKDEPLERQLWKAADKLRKNIDAAEYGNKTDLMTSGMATF